MIDLDKIYGNEAVKNALNSAARTGTISHAYLFSGERGMGKKLIANAFAKRIFCSTKESGCKCRSCRSFDSNNHTDIVTVGLDGAKSISVEVVRSKIIHGLNVKPFEYDHKIYIIENADMLTPQAQNALLRSIEEPPSFTVFMLLCENERRMLQTILSRCVVFKMERIKASTIENHLLAMGAEQEKAHTAALYAFGSIGKAQMFCESEDFFNMCDFVCNAMYEIGTGDLSDAFKLSAQFEQYKDSDFFTVILMWLRDAIAYKATSDEQYILNSSYKDKIVRYAKTHSFKDLYIKTEAVRKLKGQLDSNTPFQLAMDAAVINL